MTDPELLDRDLAIQIVTLPITLAYFAWLIVTGAVNDWRAWRG